MSSRGPSWTDQPPGLKPFLEEVEARLDGLDLEATRRLVLRYAAALSASERAGFLVGFFPAPEEREPAVYETSAEEPAELLEEIDAFVEALAEGHYFEGWGWDPEILDERAWGDESWVGDMDALFEGAAERFLAADWRTAAEAYGRLLRAFFLDEEIETFCGPDLPTEMVRTDLSEAKARCLRALYESLPAGERAERLCEEMDELLFVGGSELSLRDIQDCWTEPLPDLDGFLPDWIAVLESSGGGEEHWGWSRLRNDLLAEAVGMKAGSEGLAELARAQGEGRPSFYRDWIEALAREGRLEEAIAAAREAAERVEDDGARAALADRWAELAAENGNPRLAVAARRRAWRSEPTTDRLVGLLVEGDPAPATVDRRVRGELDAVDEGKVDLESPILSRLELLAGEHDAPAGRLAAARPLGWSAASHVGYVVFPYLLLAGAGLVSPPSGSLIEAFWLGLGEERDYRLILQQLERGRGGGPAGPGYGELLREALERRAPAAADREAFLRLARRTAEKRARAIVGNTHRKAYRRAAEVLVAAAEAHHLAGRPEEAREIVAGLRGEFPRHSAFRYELDECAAASPVLEASPRS